MTGPWWDSAACLGLADRECDPWHPTGRDIWAANGAGYDAYAEARAICAGCPVTVECLTDAATMPDSILRHGGMRAGLTPEQLVRRFDRPAVRGTAITPELVARAARAYAAGRPLGDVALAEHVCQRRLRDALTGAGVAIRGRGTVTA